MLENALLDRLLGGRGVGWIRYEPVMEASPQVSEDVEETLKYERSPCDYVAWEDFRHQPAKTWEEVEWVAREPRAYPELIDAWRTSCPRLTVWEDAVERGFVRVNAV